MVNEPTTFYDAYRSLIQVGPGAQCQDCGHFAYRHQRRLCLFPHKDHGCTCKGMNWLGQRISMGPSGPMDDPSITCPVCDMTSYNPNDVEMGYCGNCHGYTGRVDVTMQAKRVVAAAQRPLDLGDDPDGDIEGYDGA